MRGTVPALGLVLGWASAPVYAQERLSVHAEPCSVAIGGNAINSTINVVCGVPPEKIEELVRSRTKEP